MPKNCGHIMPACLLFQLHLCAYWEGSAHTPRSLFTSPILPKSWEEPQSHSVSCATLCLHTLIVQVLLAVVISLWEKPERKNKHIICSKNSKKIQFIMCFIGNRTSIRNSTLWVQGSANKSVQTQMSVEKTFLPFKPNLKKFLKFLSVVDCDRCKTTVSFDHKILSVHSWVQVCLFVPCRSFFPFFRFKRQFIP